MFELDVLCIYSYTSDYILNSSISISTSFYAKCNRHLHVVYTERFCYNFQDSNSLVHISLYISYIIHNSICAYSFV